MDALFVDPDGASMLIVTGAWLMETVGLIIFWQFYGPTFCGCIAMDVFVLLT